MTFARYAALAIITIAPLLLPASAQAQPSAARELRIALTPRFSIGGAADTSFTPERLFPNDIATDARGNLYLLDRAERRIHQFGSAGKPSRIFGRKGPG